MDLYQGLAFRSFKQVADWKEHKAYAVQHLRILSALYGCNQSRGMCEAVIRLDLTINLKSRRRNTEKILERTNCNFF